MLFFAFDKNYNCLLMNGTGAAAQLLFPDKPKEIQ